MKLRIPWKEVWAEFDRNTTRMSESRRSAVALNLLKPRLRTELKRMGYVADWDRIAVSLSGRTFTKSTFQRLVNQNRKAIR